MDKKDKEKSINSADKEKKPIYYNNRMHDNSSNNNKGDQKNGR